MQPNTDPDLWMCWRSDLAISTPATKTLPSSTAASSPVAIPLDPKTEGDRRPANVHNRPGLWLAQHRPGSMGCDCQAYLANDLKDVGA